MGKVGLYLFLFPYCELINMAVHPNFRGGGIGTLLAQGCVREAEERGYAIMTLKTDWKGNLPAKRLYHKFGFELAIPGTEGPRGNMWLFKFIDFPALQGFRRRHSFSETWSPGETVSLLGHPVYPLMHVDPITGDCLTLYVTGQPDQPFGDTGRMPLVAGIEVKEAGHDIFALLCSHFTHVKWGGTMGFRLTVENRGDNPETVGLQPVLVRGLTLTEPSLPPPSVQVPPNHETRYDFKVRMKPDFDRRLWSRASFRTVPITLRVDCAEAGSALLSAGTQCEPG